MSQQYTRYYCRRNNKLVSPAFSTKQKAEEHLSDMLIIVVDALVTWADNTKFEKRYTNDLQKLLSTEIVKVKLTVVE